VIVQAALLISLLACVPVPLGRLRLAAHGLIRRAAIGEILFIRNNLRLVVQLQAGRAEVVAELVTDELRRRAIAPLRASFYEGDTLLAIHEV